MSTEPTLDTVLWCARRVVDVCVLQAYDGPEPVVDAGGEVVGWAFEPSLPRRD